MVQLGLCIKLSSKGLHVPDYATPGPEGRGWAYSQDVAVLLKQYKVKSSGGVLACSSLI